MMKEKLKFLLDVATPSLFLLLTLFGAITFAESVRPLKESYYQNEWCKGQIEVRLPDRTRVDCLTDEYAIEIDFAINWKQGIGQSLHYALVTGKKPGIALICNQRVTPQQKPRAIGEKKYALWVASYPWKKARIYKSIMYWAPPPNTIK